MKKQIPSYSEFLIKENLSNLFNSLNKEDVEKIIEKFDESLDLEDFKSVLEQELDERSWILAEEHIEEAFETLSTSSILPSWQRPSSNVNQIMQNNLSAYKTGKQNYTDFPFGTIVKVTNEDLDSYGVIAKVKSLEGLYFRIETKEGITYECKPEDLEIVYKINTFESVNIRSAYSHEDMVKKISDEDILNFLKNPETIDDDIYFVDDKNVKYFNRDFKNGDEIIFKGKKIKIVINEGLGDVIPKRLPDIIQALVSNSRFQNKKGEVFKVLTNENHIIKFVLLDIRGNETNHVRSFKDELLAKLFISKEFFFTEKFAGVVMSRN